MKGLHGNDGSSGCVITLLLAVCALAGCESEQTVGSECPDGVCPLQGSLAAPACLLGNTTAEVAISSLVPPEAAAASEPDAPWLCLPRALARGESGLVSCKLIWTLPAAGEDGPGDCSELAYAHDTGVIDDLGRVQCELDQLAVVDGALPDDAGQGWYYDDFSQGVLQSCPAATPQRITATQAPTGGTLKLGCLSALADASEVAPELALNVDTVQVAPEMCAAVPHVEAPDLGAPCTPGAMPELGFDDREAYVEVGAPECDSRACLVYRVLGNVSPDCEMPDAGDAAPSTRCAQPEEVKDRVYCSCRCSAPDGEDVDPSELCDCVDGFTCIDVLPLGPGHSSGGYCVKNGTFTQ